MIIALLTLALATGCVRPETGHAPPSQAPSSYRSSYPTPTQQSDPIIAALSGIAGVSEVTVASSRDDSYCWDLAGVGADITDVSFTARGPTAMLKALTAGRDAVSRAGLGEACLAGRYANSGHAVRIDVSDPSGNGDGLWPIPRLIGNLVAASARPLRVGDLHLVWHASAEETTRVELGTDVDWTAPSDSEALAAFRVLQRDWRPPAGFDASSLFVSGTEGYLTSEQRGGSAPWRTRIPDNLLDSYARVRATTHDAHIDRRVDEDGTRDGVDFLWTQDDPSVGWTTRQHIARELIRSWRREPAAQRADSFTIRAGHGTALDFDSSACNGVLPGSDHRQAKEQTRALYQWYADHYPRQAAHDGVDRC